MRCFKQNERTKRKKHDPARTRTWNLLIRNQTPYPLGHEADILLTVMRNCSPIGHNNTKHFLCPIRSQHRLEFLEMVRWESVPRGSSVLTWKLSFRRFSRPDWLPPGSPRMCNMLPNSFHWFIHIILCLHLNEERDPRDFHSFLFPFFCTLQILS